MLSDRPGNGLDDAAVSDPLAIAIPTHYRQFIAQGGELSQSFLDCGEVTRCDCHRFSAIAARLAGERNERTNLLDREAQPAAVANEVEPIDIAKRISAPIRLGPYRPIEQPDLLIEADRRHLGGGRAGQLSDHHAVLFSSLPASVSHNACFYSD